jgi:hypothetical protein
LTRSRNAPAPAHEEDFVAWLEDQARPRAAARPTGSISKTSPELEGMPRSDGREIRNCLTVLLVHLLKYKVQPRRRSSGWIGTIGEQRRLIANIIDDSLSLRSFHASILDRCYADARSGAASETGLSESAFPEGYPFGMEEILDARWQLSITNVVRSRLSEYKLL